MIVERAQRSLDIVPPLLVLETTPDELDNHRAPPSTPSPPIKLGDDRIVNGDVQAHVHTLAHCALATATGPVHVDTAIADDIDAVVHGR
jgi:hypothetical protein